MEMGKENSTSKCTGAFINQLKRNSGGRARLAAATILILLAALAFTQPVVTSAVGKLWHGLSPASTETRKETKTAPGKSTALSTAQKVAVLATDKSDYLAGEAIVITGAGFLPNERVALQAKHADGAAEPGRGHEAKVITAGDDGGFTATWQVNAHDSAGNHFTLIAVGASGATARASFNRIASARTERTDYRPGETVAISGAGFQPGELVTLQVVQMSSLLDVSSHAPFNVVSDANGNISASWQAPASGFGGSMFKFTATGGASGLQAVILIPTALISVIDDGGPDDVGGSSQRDLNAMAIDFAALPTSLAVNWNWDNTGFTGGNTGDACSLYDTDNDGFANFALCVVVNSNPAVYVSTRLYSCNDTRTDRCAGDTLIGDDDGGTPEPSIASVCSASVVANSDPFRLNPAHTASKCGVAATCVQNDTVAVCTVQTSDLGGAADPFLLNVCAYPSQQPNSDPSDCVVAPDSGFLTIVKVANPSDSTTFTFNTNRPSPPAPPTSFTVTGSGSASLISFPAGTTYSVAEVVPSGWQLDSASCVLSGGGSTGTKSGATISNIQIQAGLETTCTFTNTKCPAAPTTTGASRCGPGSVTLSASGGGGTLKWYSDAGLTTLVNTGPSFTTPSLSATTTYFVTETGATGCVGPAASVVATINTIPNVSAGADKVLTCTTTQVTLDGSSTTPGATFSWSGPGGFTSTSATPAVNAPGTYTLTVTNPAGGCTATDTVEVTQNITPPNVDAGADKTLTCTTTSVTLNGSSTTPGATFSWSGPGGFSSTSATPSVSASGLYTLTVTNPANGCTASDTVNVAQNITPPNVDAGPDKTLTCATTSVTLNGASSTPGATFSWSGPGGFSSTSATPSVSAPGLYTLTATNPANGCTASDTVNVGQDIATPNVNAGPDKELTCTVTSVTLNGSSSTPGATFSWSGPGGFSSTSATPSVSAPGLYTLTATNPANGCTASDTVNVTQNITPPNVDAGADKTLTCAVTSVTLNGSSSTLGATFSWSGPGGFSSTSATPSVSAPGLYTLTVTNPANGCTASDTVNVGQDIAAPNVDAGPDKTLTCAVTSVMLNGSSSTPGATFSWSGPGGFTSTSATPTTNAPGLYTLTVTNPANGCTASDTVNVAQDIAAPNVNAGLDKTLTCATTSVTLDGSSSTPGATFSWSGPGGFSSTSATPSVSAPGLYTLTVTNPANGCTASDTVNVAQNIAPPNVDAGPDKELTCSVTSVTLNGSSSTPGAAFSWSGPGGFTSTSATPSANAPGLYTLTVTNPVNGCTASDTVNVAQNVALPNVDAGADKTLTCAVTSVTLDGSSSTPGATFSWSGPGGFSSTSATPSVSAPGLYTLTVTNPANGCTASDTVNVGQNIAPPNVSAGADMTLTCATTSVTLNGSSSTPGATFSWSGPGGFTSTSATPTVSTPGLYTLTVTNPANGCTASDTVNVAQNTTAPNVDAGPDKALTCTVTSVQLQGSSSTPGATFSWSGPGGFTSTSATPTISAPGLYTLTVTNPANGCTATDTATVSQSVALPGAGATGGTLTCSVTSVQLQGSSPTAGVTFSWAGPGGFTSGLQNPTVTAPGSYVLTVTNPANGCTSTATATVGQNTTLPNCLIATPSQLPVCGSAGNTLSANTGGAAVIVWSLDAAAVSAGWAITGGQGTSTITYTAGTGPATFTLALTGANGCTSTCGLNLSCATPLGNFCTLTQGAYGNRNGRFNGIRRDALIAQLLNATPLTLGKTAARSITYANNAASTVDCIIGTMPAGGTASAFPSGLNVSIPPSTCSALAPVIGSTGKFRNVLIGQTLALSLNVRLDMNGLGSRTLCSTFVTKRALPGPDKLLGTNDDVIDPTDPGQTFTIPASVFTALTSLSLPHTVNGLLELANRALANQPTGGASFSNINAAVDAINRGFDECRFLISCGNGVANLNVPGGLDHQRYEERGHPADFAAFVNSLDSFGSIANTRYPLGPGASVPAGFEAEMAYGFRDWLLPLLREQRR